MVNMNWKIWKNDFRKNRAGNVALLSFMILASWLIVAATIVVTTLLTSMKGMYLTSQPPHFLQMHKGTINEEQIDNFNQGYSGVTDWQNVAMIDVYGEQLQVSGHTQYDLSDCRLDISLVKQNKSRDLLLDADRNVLHLHPGEIGIPMLLKDTYDIQLGDIVTLTENGSSRQFQVAAFVYDAQMNSTMCSSTRMLISDTDFDELLGKVGETEYLLETYFTDTSLASNYQTAYENAGLPQNGQAVTYQMIFLLSAMSDLALAMIFIAVSILLVMIALLCMKYTILASIEDELTEIGMMKAIGMTAKDVGRLYLRKYQLMMVAGGMCGYVLALASSKVFLSHIRNTFGNEQLSVLAIVLPIAAGVLLYVLTVAYCRRIFRKIHKISVVDALVTGKGLAKKEAVKGGIHRSGYLPMNLLLGIREVVRNFRGFAVICITGMVVTLMLTIPLNVLHTMQAKEFVTYMGSSTDDMLIEVSQGENLEDRYDAMKLFLQKQSKDIAEYQEQRSVCVKAYSKDEQWINLHIDCGPKVGEELQYLTGKAPAVRTEIALSKLNADALGKAVGDAIVIRINGENSGYKVSGIYQDVTSGGYTAKVCGSLSELPAEKYSFLVNFKAGRDIEKIAAIWREKMGGGYEIESMEQFLQQTLGGVIKQVKMATMAVVVLGFLLIALVVILFLKLRLARDREQIAIMKSIGFMDDDIKKQYQTKMLLAALPGIVIGIVLANWMGSTVVGAALSFMGLGLSRITFLIQPWLNFVILPLLLLIVIACITWITCKKHFFSDLRII